MHPLSGDRDMGSPRHLHGASGKESRDRTAEGDIVRSVAPVHATLRQMAAVEPIRIRIRGTCMAPALPDGAWVRVARRRIYWPGDVLVFSAADGRLTAHRLLGGARRRGQFKLFTRADNASAIDAAILASQVIGRVIGGDCHPKIAPVSISRRVQSMLQFSRAAFTRLGCLRLTRSGGGATGGLRRTGGDRPPHPSPWAR